jgi:hypothetical protein
MHTVLRNSIERSYVSLLVIVSVLLYTLSEGFQYRKPCSCQFQKLATLQTPDLSDPTTLKAEKPQRLAADLFMLCVDSQTLTNETKVIPVFGRGLS